MFSVHYSSIRMSIYMLSQVIFCIFRNQSNMDNTEEFLLLQQKTHTSVLRFICQCWSCSWGLRQLLLLSVSGKHPSTSIGSVTASSSVALFSWIEGKVLQSRGLQSPKSESFMCPSLSKRRLSGLISLEKKKSGKTGQQDVRKYHCLHQKLANYDNFQNRPMNIVVSVYGLNGQDTLSNIESCNIFPQCILPHEQSHHITTRKVLHNQV